MSNGPKDWTIFGIFGPPNLGGIRHERPFYLKLRGNFWYFRLKKVQSSALMSGPSSPWENSFPKSRWKCPAGQLLWRPHEKRCQYRRPDGNSILHLSHAVAVRSGNSTFPEVRKKGRGEPRGLCVVPPFQMRIDDSIDISF